MGGRPAPARVDEARRMVRHRGEREDRSGRGGGLRSARGPHPERGTVIPRRFLAALDALILERQHDGRFVAVGDLPPWCRRLMRVERIAWESPLAADDAFPF